MARRRTAAQIHTVVKAVERDLARGLGVADSCRRHGISEQSYYRWRRRNAIAADDTAPAAAPGERRGRASQAVAGRGNARQPDAPRGGEKKVVTGPQQRAAGAYLQQRFRVSQRRAARALGRSRSSLRYRPRPRDNEMSLVREIRRLVRRHPRFGYRRIWARLVARGWRVNVKRVRRLWRALGLKRRIRRKPQGKGVFPGSSANSCMARPATAINDVWTCDFIHDRTMTGGSLKWLSVVDEYTRELLVLVPAATMSAADVRRVFGGLVGVRGIVPQPAARRVLELLDVRRCGGREGPSGVVQDGVQHGPAAQWIELSDPATVRRIVRRGEVGWSARREPAGAKSRVTPSTII